MSGAAPGSAFDIRPARRADVPAVAAMIRALADYEKLGALCVFGDADLDEALFGAQPAAEVLVACAGEEHAGFALYFHNFSTFLGRRGLWLEDLYVRPEHRRRGCAKALLRAVAAVAAERRCGRFEWAVLDWNAPAIEFYRSLGAAILPDWRIVRVAGAAIARVAADGGG